MLDLSIVPTIFRTNSSGTIGFELNGTSCSSNTFDVARNNAAHDWLSFEVPESFLDSTTFGFPPGFSIAGGKYGVVLPDLQVLISGVHAFTISSAVGALLAFILYRFIVTTRHSFLFRFTIGFIVLLATVAAPYAIIDAIGIQNTAIRFVVCIPGVLFLFRTLEALFNFVPEGARSSFKVYVVYFCFPVEVLFDKQSSKPISVSWRDLFCGAVNILRTACIVSTLLSIFSAYEYVPFKDSRAGEFYEDIKTRDYLDAKHLVNCFCHAILFQSSLSFGDAVFGLTAELLTGFKVMKTMKNPMLTSTSPSDFWGRKWNLLVHSVMKRGVYKPVRLYASATAAALAVFIASGLFHEGLVHAIFIFRQPGTARSENIVLGSNSAFFIWNFFVIMGEKILGQSKVVQKVGRSLPRFMVTFLIIMCSLPFAHWFSQPYIRGSFFFGLRKISSSTEKA